MIQLIVRKDVQGYYADMVIRRACQVDVETTYLDKFNVSDVAQYNPDASVIIVFGFPVVKSEFSIIEKNMEQYNNAFSSFYHFCSFGEQIPLDWVTSVVAEDYSPLKAMWDNIHWDTDANLLKGVPEKGEDITQLVDILDKYHRYVFFEEGDITPLYFKLLGEFYKEKLYDNMLETPTKSIISNYQDIVEILVLQWHTYVNKVMERVSWSTVGDIHIAMVYAEDHVNEIAHMITETMKGNRMGKGVVLIGKHTREDDMFHVRTLNLDASDVARRLNNGKGKADSAIVFLGNSTQVLSSTVFNVLSNSYKNNKN